MDFSNQHLPLNQSTPRTSFGQKLLNNSDFLNFSNVSTYSLGSNKPGNIRETFLKQVTLTIFICI